MKVDSLWTCTLIAQDVMNVCVAICSKKCEGVLVVWFFTVEAIACQNRLSGEILKALFLEDLKNSAGQETE